MAEIPQPQLLLEGKSSTDLPVLQWQKCHQLSIYQGHTVAESLPL